MRRSLPKAARLLGRLALTGVIAAPLYVAVYRPLQLRWGATAEEVARAMPGDEIQQAPVFNATRAVTVDAPPQQVWPWLVQIGYRRAGWYSNLDWLDNAGIPSAERVIPELQQLRVGDALPVWTDIDDRVVAVQPNSYLLVTSASGRDSWLWALEPVDAQRTRLIWRMRMASYAWSSPVTLARQLAADLGDFVVARNILLGITERAEGQSAGSLAAGTPAIALWVLSFLGFLASLVGLAVRRDWVRPLLAIPATYGSTLLLAFAMPPLWVDALAVLGMYSGLWRLYRASGARRAMVSKGGPTARLI